MKGDYFIEGHRPRTTVDDEETSTVNDHGFETLEAATAKAKEFFDREPDLGLAVIYRREPDGTSQGVKFIFKDEDGTFQDFPLYWDSCDRCCEG